MTQPPACHSSSSGRSHTYPNYAKIFASYLYPTVYPHPPIEGHTKTRMLGGGAKFLQISNFPPPFPPVFHPFPPISPSRPPLSPSRPPLAPFAPFPPSFLHLGPSPQLSAILAAIAKPQTEAAQPHRPALRHQEFWRPDGTRHCYYY